MSDERQVMIRQTKPYWLPFLGYTDIKGVPGFQKAFVFQWFSWGYVFWLKGTNDYE